MMVCRDRDTGPVQPAVCSAAPSAGSIGISFRVTTRIVTSPCLGCYSVDVLVHASDASTVPQRWPTWKPRPWSTAWRHSASGLLALQGLPDFFRRQGCVEMAYANVG